MQFRSDEAIARMAIEAGWISRQQATACEQVQSRLPKPIHLGHLLVKKGFLDRAQLSSLVERARYESRAEVSPIADPSEAPLSFQPPPDELVVDAIRSLGLVPGGELQRLRRQAAVLRQPLGQVLVREGAIGAETWMRFVEDLRSGRVPAPGEKLRRPLGASSSDAAVQPAAPASTPLFDTSPEPAPVPRSPRSETVQLFDKRDAGRSRRKLTLRMPSPEVRSEDPPHIASAKRRAAEIAGQQQQRSERGAGVVGRRKKTLSSSTEAVPVSDAPPSTSSASRLSIEEALHGKGVSIPKEFGKFTVIEELARGGKGVVYKAYQEKKQRYVALKVLRSGDDATAEEAENFRKEAMAAAKLKHPNIIKVYEVGTIQDTPYFTMEYAVGKSLASYIKRNPNSGQIQRRVALVAAVADAVEYGHTEGIIHRDLKPGNILIGSDKRPRVTDFGLARDMGISSGDASGSGAAGTPFYMPPEQARGETLDGRVDVYAIGVILYQLLTGRLPYKGKTPLEVYHKLLEHTAARPSELNPEVPEDLELVCLKAMAKSRSERYQTAGALAEDLRHWLHGEPISARRTGTFKKLIRKFWS